MNIKTKFGNSMQLAPVAEMGAQSADLIEAGRCESRTPLERDFPQASFASEFADTVTETPQKTSSPTKPSRAHVLDDPKQEIKSEMRTHLKDEVFRRLLHLGSATTVGLIGYGIGCLGTLGSGLVGLAVLVPTSYWIANAVCGPNNFTKINRAEKLFKIAGALDNENPSQRCMENLRLVNSADFEILASNVCEGFTSAIYGRFGQLGPGTEHLSSRQVLATYVSLATAMWQDRERLGANGIAVVSPSWLAKRLSQALEEYRMEMSYKKIDTFECAIKKLNELAK